MCNSIPCVNVFVGMPAPPSSLESFYVRYTSVELDWDSGFDMGSRQYFIVYYWDNGTESFQQVIIAALNVLKSDTSTMSNCDRLIGTF